MSHKPESVFQFKISLAGIKPTISNSAIPVSDGILFLDKQAPADTNSSAEGMHPPGSGAIMQRSFASLCPEVPLRAPGGYFGAQRGIPPLRRSLLQPYCNTDPRKARERGVRV
jgi:hypothetical protein